MHRDWAHPCRICAGTGPHAGTTAIVATIIGRKLYVANVGDSRAVMAERIGNKLVAVDLSVDQTPFRKDELERVKRCGSVSRAA